MESIAISDVERSKLWKGATWSLQSFKMKIGLSSSTVWTSSAHNAFTQSTFYDSELSNILSLRNITLGMWHGF